VTPSTVIGAVSFPGAAPVSPSASANVVERGVSRVEGLDEHHRVDHPIPRRLEQRGDRAVQ